MCGLTIQLLLGQRDLVQLPRDRTELLLEEERLVARGCSRLVLGRTPSLASLPRAIVDARVLHLLENHLDAPAGQRRDVLVSRSHTGGRLVAQQHGQVLERPELREEGAEPAGRRRVDVDDERRTSRER